MKKKKFGLESHGYVAPRAESVGMCNQGLLCASINGGLQSYSTEETIGGWDDIIINP